MDYASCRGEHYASLFNHWKDKYTECTDGFRPAASKNDNTSSVKYSYKYKFDVSTIDQHKWACTEEVITSTINWDKTIKNVLENLGLETDENGIVWDDSSEYGVLEPKWDASPWLLN